MNGYDFTERVRRVLQRAREEAIGLRHEYVGTEHMLLALGSAGGIAEATLNNLGVDLPTMRENVLNTVKPGIERPTGPDLPYTSRAKKVLELSIEEARDLNHAYVGTEHLLLGLLREERGIGAQILTSMGATTTTARNEVVRLLRESPRTDGLDSVTVPRRPATDAQALITLVVEHPDGRIEARKFRRSDDAVKFLNGLEH